MNLILLSDEHFLNTRTVRLTGRHFLHVKDILKVKVGSFLTVGRVNGLIGQGKVSDIHSEHIDLKIVLKQKPPAPLDLTVIMALPRPPMLKRSLQSLASLGVKKIIILNFHKVEKSLWQSSALSPESMREDLVLGLEQAKDTVLPEIILEKRFKAFVEDRLPGLVNKKHAYVAHPGVNTALPRAEDHCLRRYSRSKGASKAGKVLIIGPEGGISDFEIDLLKSKGLHTVSLGPRILRFENALIYAIGQMS